MYPKTNKRIQRLTASGNQDVVAWAFSPNETYLAVALKNNYIDFYKKENSHWGKLCKPPIGIKFSEERIKMLSFSENEKILNILTNHQIILIDIEKEKIDLSYDYLLLHDEALCAFFKNNYSIIIGTKSLSFKRKMACAFLREKIIHYSTSTNNVEKLTDYLCAEKKIMLIFTNNLYIVDYTTDAQDNTQHVSLSFESTIKTAAFSPCNDYCFIIVETKDPSQQEDLNVYKLEKDLNRWIKVSFTKSTPPSKKITIAGSKQSFLMLQSKYQPLKVVLFDKKLETTLKYLGSCEYFFDNRAEKILFEVEGKLHLFHPAPEHLRGHGLRSSLEPYSLESRALFFSPKDNYLIIKDKASNATLTLMNFDKKSPPNMSIMDSPERGKNASYSVYFTPSSKRTARLGQLSPQGNYLVSVFSDYAEIRKFYTNFKMELHDYQKASLCAFSFDEKYFSVAFKENKKILILLIEEPQKSQPIILNLNNAPIFLFFSNNTTLFVIEENGMIFFYDLNFHCYTQATFNILSYMNFSSIVYLPSNNTLMMYGENELTSLNMNTHTASSSPLVSEVSVPASPASIYPPPGLDIHSNMIANDSGYGTTPPNSPASTRQLPIAFSTPVLKENSFSLLKELACFSPGGTYLAVKRNNKTELFDVQFQKKIRCFDTPDATCYEFSPDNDYLAIISNHMLFIYSIAFGKEVQTIQTLSRIGLCKFSPTMASIFLWSDVEGLTNHRISLVKTRLFNNNFSPKQKNFSRLGEQFIVDFNRNAHGHFSLNRESLCSDKPDTDVSLRLPLLIKKIGSILNLAYEENEKNFLIVFIMSVLHQGSFSSNPVNIFHPFFEKESIHVSFSEANARKINLSIKKINQDEFLFFVHHDLKFIVHFLTKDEWGCPVMRTESDGDIIINLFYSYRLKNKVATLVDAPRCITFSSTLPDLKKEFDDYILKELTITSEDNFAVSEIKDRSLLERNFLAVEKAIASNSLGVDFLRALNENY